METIPLERLIQELEEAAAQADDAATTERHTGGNAFNEGMEQGRAMAFRQVRNRALELASD